MNSLLLPFSQDRLDQATQSQVHQNPELFIFVPLTCVEPVRVVEPERPDYIVVTSQSALSSLRVQTWFDASWLELPGYAVGEKTAKALKDEGFVQAMHVPPPAPQILKHLPEGKGLWLSGEEVAHDLCAQCHSLARLPLYRVRVHEAGREKAATTLRSGQVVAALITSARVGQELAALGAGLPRIAVMGHRLRTLAKNWFPDAKIDLVPTLELSVPWHLKWVQSRAGNS